MRLRFNRRAFTLLEMLLTLAMAVVLMGLVSGAINFYARDMATAENEFRLSQVATSVLQMIEDDLRMTQVTRPVDTAPLAEVLSSAAAPLEALGLGGAMAGGSGEAELPPDETSSSSTDDSLATDAVTADSLSTDPLAIGGVLQAPGLIGNASMLQVDVSRLPTLESYAIDPSLAGYGAAGELLDRPSDLKTVTYWVLPPGTAGPVDPLDQLALQTTGATVSSATSPSGGLARRAIDRAISAQASSTGGLSQLSQTGQILAPEITAIQFEYFDGSLWLTQYSSDETGYLPPAIRVTLTVGTVTSEATTATTARTFSHVIHLPMSFPKDGEAATGGTDGAMGGSTDSTTGGAL